MRVSAIQNYQRNTYFAGEKKDKLKNAAGAAALAIATAAPMANANAQYYYTPPLVLPPPTTIQRPGSVPDCFIIGDLKTFNGAKSMKQVFNEIDANGNENGTISANEVIRTDRNNKIRYNVYPYNVYTQYQSQQTRNQFQSLSEAYNEEGSNPNTINYNEYKAIMEDFLDTKEITNFIDLFSTPGIIYPLPPLYDPFRHDGPPHHHRHRDHDGPPRHHRR